MESKTVVYTPDVGSGSGSGMMAMLAPLLQQKGIDPNLLMALNSKGNGNGFGGDGVAGIPNLINNDAGRELLMSAIQGNGQAINNLATNLNCSIGQVQNAINGVMSQVQQVGNQVGQSSMQIINAIQQGNCQIAQQIASCCCENRLAICQQTNTLQNAINGVATGQERGFASVAYETQRQTCDLQNSIKDSTQQILAGQRAAEMREMQNKIDKLREENSTFKSSAMTSQIVGQATAPLGAALNDLSARLAKIERKQPETVTIPYIPAAGNYIPVNYSVPVNMSVSPYSNCGC